MEKDLAACSADILTIIKKHGLDTMQAALSIEAVKIALIEDIITGMMGKDGTKDKGIPGVA